MHDDAGRHFLRHGSLPSNGEAEAMGACTALPLGLASPRLRADLVRMLAHRIAPEDLDDLVQTTLAEALSCGRAPAAEEDLRRFVFSIARQRLVDLYRRRGRERRWFDHAADVDGPSSRASESPDDLLRWVERELPHGPDARQTLDWMMREGAGETLAEIAASDNVSNPVVRQRVSRMRRYLRGRWAKEIAAIGLLGSVALVLAAVFARAPSIAPDPASSRSTVAAENAERPFDRAAAAEVLGGVGVGACAESDGPRGNGHVTVTFSNDGKVAQAVIDGGPFSGTLVGDCIAAKYAATTVPPFVGAPVRVGKSFTLE